MTIKIITRGELPEEKIKQYQCKHCCSVLEVPKKDTALYFDTLDGSYYWKFQCPVCSKEQHIYSWE